MKLHIGLTALFTFVLTVNWGAFAFSIVTFVYCSYLFYMYKTDSKIISIGYIAVSVLFNLMYMADLFYPYAHLLAVGKATDSSRFLYVFNLLSTALYQLMEFYLLLKNELYKINRSITPFEEKAHLYTMFFFLGLLWNASIFMVKFVWNLKISGAKGYLMAFGVCSVCLVNLLAHLVNTNFKALRKILIGFALMIVVQSVFLSVCVFWCLNVALGDSAQMQLHGKGILMEFGVNAACELVSLVFVEASLFIELKKYFTWKESQKISLSTSLRFPNIYSRSTVNSGSFCGEESVGNLAELGESVDLGGVE